MVSRSNIKQEITKPGDIKMKKKVTKRNIGGKLSPAKAKELNSIMNASESIAENLQKQSMIGRKRGGIIDGDAFVSSYYEKA